MAGIRTLSRWGSLLAVVLGAAVSVGLSAVVAACGGKSETDDRTAKPDAGDSAADAGDGEGDAKDAMDGPIISVDVVTPTDDVSLDTVPAE